MFVHSVYFWLKPDITGAERARFDAGLESLRAIESVRACHIGAPAATDRPVIDRSYSAALTVIFDDLAGHDIYQVHPIHKAFVEQCATCWINVVIYDAE